MNTRKYISVTAFLQLLAFNIAAPDAMAINPERTPYIQWTPPEIATVISIGHPITINVNIQNLAILPNAVLDAVLFVPDRDLAQFITISPTRLLHLQRNTVTPVSITFSIPQSMTAPTMRRLTGIIKLDTTTTTTISHPDKSNLDTALFPPLSITLTISDDATVGGTDANNNGIRDDIDQYMQQTFTDTSQKAAAINFASALQAGLLQAGDKTASLNNASRLDAATTCISSFSDLSVRNKLIDIQPQTLNTQVRNTAWFAFNAQLSGGYSTGIVGNALSDACTQ